MSSLQRRQNVKFKTILADTPWNESGGGKSKRGADRHYDLMNTGDIAEQMKLWCKEHVHEETAHMYLWVTNNFLSDGIRVMEECGFRYITNLVWVKDKKGLGQYFRGEHELCLFGVRGKLPSRSNSIGTVIRASRGQHSRKPRKIYQIIRTNSHEPYLEVFARDCHADFKVIGDEAPKEKQELLA